MIGTGVRYLLISVQDLMGQNQEVFKLSFFKGWRFSDPTDSQELQGILSPDFSGLSKWPQWIFSPLLFLCP